MSYQPVASPADVEWVDTHGDTQVCGYKVTSSDIAALEAPGDRRPNGKLTREALRRIATVLSTHLRLLHVQTLAAYGVEPGSIVYPDRDGLAQRHPTSTVPLSVRTPRPAPAVSRERTKPYDHD